MKNRLLIHFVCIIFTCFLFYFSSLAKDKLPVDFETWVENSRQDWKIPGMAIGIVKNGKVVYAKGYGFTKVENGKKVDENTVFSIASVSKNITAAALALLVDRGQINWDDKIVDHIPGFRMKNPWITNEITIRDALTHRVGLGRILGNRLQYMTNHSRDEVLFQMRYMDLEKPFRSTFVYNNVMYSLAGQIIEYVDGRTWDMFLLEEFFIPLEMKNSSTSINALHNLENVAYPHQEIEGKIVQIKRRNWDNAGPAGGINASVSDLNKWMLLQLGEAGKYKNRQLISSKQMKEMHTAQVIRGREAENNPAPAYGFGWNVQYYEGYKVLTHGGATDGFNTAMYLMPELDLGIIVVANTFNSLGNAIAFQVFDAYLGKNYKDWNEHYLVNYKNKFQNAKKERKIIHDNRVQNTNRSLPIKEYLGLYESESYGKLEVYLQGEDIYLKLWEDKEMTARLEHWHFDTHRAIWNNIAMREEFVQFYLNTNGKIVYVEIDFVLRPKVLQVGAYPSDYTRKVCFIKKN